VSLTEESEALERADADVAMAEPRKHGRAGRGRFVAPLEGFAGLKQGERLRRVHAEGLQHLGRKHLANAAFERQAAVGGAAVGRLARAFGAEVEKAIAVVPKLPEGEAAPVADVGIVHAELVAVVP